MRAKHAISAAALLAACSAEAVRPLDARDVAFLRAAQAQAVRIAAMTDEEVARELASPEGQPVAERLRPELASLDHWLELLRCQCSECSVRANGGGTQAARSEGLSRSDLSAPGANWASAAQT